MHFVRIHYLFFPALAKMLMLSIVSYGKQNKGHNAFKRKIPYAFKIKYYKYLPKMALRIILGYLGTFYGIS